MIQCSNPHCRALSPYPASHCQTCKTPLHYRFLQAVSDSNAELAAGALVADRYQVCTPHIWLDTQPDAPVVPLELLPRFIVPYLRLSAMPLHVPRPFTVLTPEENGVPTKVLLLDEAAIGSHLTDKGEVEAFLLPALAAVWPEGSALQQLNWLRQIAQLWLPCAHEGVAATLLNLDQLRVDHALLRIAYLTLDAQSQQEVTLAELGQQWKGLLPTAKAEIQPYLDWLVTSLIAQDMSSADALLAELGQGVRALAEGLSLSLDWVAYTDQGPERPRNEDACYPQGQLHQGQLAGHEGQDLPLLLVCDGIGGHEQGNVASQTAVNALFEELQPLADHPDLGPKRVEEQIYRAMALANDLIAARNNDENRSARARMGTTVVLALVHFPYVSVGHLGDSRAYRISDRTCYQLTLDDNIASRETRLGYTLYQEALQIPSSGALIQALGIGDSAQLYPTVHHLLIDDPAVLLLCSDGLSDNDRVEMLWRQYVSPLVLSWGDLQPIGQELIQQANQLNGHDNVTVGLLRFMPNPSTYSPLAAAPLHHPEAPTPDSVGATQLVSPGASPSPAELETPPPGKGIFAAPLVIGGAAMVALMAGLATWLNQLQQPPTPALASLTLPLSLVKVQANSLDDMAWAVAEAIEVGSYWQAGHASPVRQPQNLELNRRPTPTPETTPATEPETAPSSQGSGTPALVPTGSILKVVSQQTAADQTTWVRLQICSIPSGASLDQTPQETDGEIPDFATDSGLDRRLLSPGQSGWVIDRTLYRSATAIPQPTTTQRGECNP